MAASRARDGDPRFCAVAAGGTYASDTPIACNLTARACLAICRLSVVCTPGTDEGTYAAPMRGRVR